MSFSDYPIEKKVQTLLRDISFFYCREWYDDIPEEDTDGDIKNAHDLLNDEFSKSQINAFFFKVNYRAIWFPAIALLMFYKFNPKFAEYVNSVYMSDEQLIDDLHEYYFKELKQRMQSAILEKEINKSYSEKIDNTKKKECSKTYLLYIRCLQAVASPNDDEIVPVPPPPEFLSDKDIKVLKAEVWNKKLKIDFLDDSPIETYYVRFYKFYEDGNSEIVRKSSGKLIKTDENSNVKTVVIADCSPKLFSEYVWDIKRG